MNEQTLALQQVLAQVAGLIERGKHDEARILLRPAIEQAPKNVRLRILKARSELKNPDYAERCGSLLARVYQIRPDAPSVRALQREAEAVISALLDAAIAPLYRQNVSQGQAMLQHAAHLCQHDSRLTVEIALRVAYSARGWDAPGEQPSGVNDEDPLTTIFGRPRRPAPPPVATPSVHDLAFGLEAAGAELLFMPGVTSHPLAAVVEQYLGLALDRAAGDEPLAARIASLLFQFLVSIGKRDSALALLANYPEIAGAAPRAASALSGQVVTTIRDDIYALLRCGLDAAAADALARLASLLPDRNDTDLIAAELAFRNGDEEGGLVWLRLAARPAPLEDPPVAWQNPLMDLLATTRKAVTTCRDCGAVTDPDGENCSECGCEWERHELALDRAEWASLPPQFIAGWWLGEKLLERDDLAGAQAALEPVCAGLEPDTQAAVSVRQRMDTINALLDEQKRASALTAIMSADPVTASALSALRQEAASAGLPWARVAASLRIGFFQRAIRDGFVLDIQPYLPLALADVDDQPAVEQVTQARDATVQVMVAAQVAESARALALGDASGALALARQACQLRPGDAHAVHARARASRALRDDVTALQDYQTVVERADDAGVLAEARLAAAELLAAQHNTDAALSMLADAEGPNAARLRERLQRLHDKRPALAIEWRDQAVMYDSLEREPVAPMVHATFAIALRAISRPWGMSEAGWVDAVLNSGRRFVQTIGGLPLSEGDPVFGLRLICEPDTTTTDRGTITMALLARVSATDEPACMSLAGQLHNLLVTVLPGQDNHAFWFESVWDEEELARLLGPFEATTACEIVRREERTADGGVPVVYPFLPSSFDLHALCATLLKQPGPTMLSIHLQPTVLFSWETHVLREALGTYAAVQDVMVPVHGAESQAWKGLQRQSAGQVAINQLGHLSARAYLLQVNVLGSGAVNAHFAETVAASLFGSPQAVGNALYGGWQVMVADTPEKFAAAVRNCSNLDLERWLNPVEDRNLARLRYLASESEAVLTFRLPVPLHNGLPGVRSLAAKPIRPPSNMPAAGTVYGESVARMGGRPAPIVQGYDDRRRHAFILGKTGTGKSTLLSQMVLQDIARGDGVCVVDPHGDLIHDILAHMPESRADDVIIFDAADSERPIGLNLLEYTTEQQKQRIVTEFISMLMRMYDPGQIGIVGPRFQHNVRMAMLTAMAVPGNTLIEVVRVLSSREYMKSLLVHVTDPIVKLYWEEQIARTSDYHQSEILDYLVSKFNRFVGDERVRNIIGQRKSALDFREIMDKRKILLVNLSKGLVGEDNAQFLGLLLVQRLLIAALGRADMPADQRPDFVMYVDEFQNFATELFATMLSEGRKYGMVCVLANQYLTQIEHEVQDAIFGNVGTLVCFRLGMKDAQQLASEMYPALDDDDLINLPKFTAATKLLVGGEVEQPFTMRTLPLLGSVDPVLAQRVRQASRERYGTDAAAVSRDILERFKLLGK